jgi:hypothetical protein
MKSRFCKSVTVLVSILFAVEVNASSVGGEVVLPAGSILKCVLEDPNFSSATVTIGDPIVCELREAAGFGQQAFPKGGYLLGHLDAAKDPGHFFGKGNLKLQFDRIGLPSGDLPLNARVISIRGHKVDKEGRIAGKGHAKLDLVEWMLPPLWPWKVIMLPARGPLPRLKPESTLSLRLMEDVEIVSPIAHRYGPEQRPFGDPRNDSFDSSAHGEFVGPGGRSTDQMALKTQQAPCATSLLHSVPKANITTDVTLFILKRGTVLAATDYALQDGRIAYNLSGGGGGTASFDEVDWNPTISVNAQRGLPIFFRSGETSLSQLRDSIQPKADAEEIHPLTLIALKDGGAYATREYWVDGWRMHCIIGNGEEKLIALDRIDLATTICLNRERDVKFVLQSKDRIGEK